MRHERGRKGEGGEDIINLLIDVYHRLRFFLSLPIFLLYKTKPENFHFFFFEITQFSL